MAWVTVRVGESKWRFELAPVTIVGRHSRCDVCLELSKVPLYWLEIRWSGNQWVWRTLGDSTHTAGSGKELARGWKTLERGGRVQRGSSVKLHVDSDGEPEVMLWDMIGRHWVSERGRAEVLDVAGPVVSHRTDHGSLEEVHDGDVITYRERAFRVRIPQRQAVQESVVVDAEAEPLSVEIDTTNLRAVFDSGVQEYAVKGECVRVLASYAEARLSALDEDGGWVTLAAAYEGWVELGGNPDSPQRRMSWEKGKLRKQLSRQDAPDIQQIFENHTLDGIPVCRLGLASQNIFEVE